MFVKLTERNTFSYVFCLEATPIHMTLTKSPVQESPPSKPPAQRPLAKAPPVVSKSPYIDSFLNDDDDDLNDGELIARLTALDANIGATQQAANKVSKVDVPACHTYLHTTSLFCVSDCLIMVKFLCSHYSNRVFPLLALRYRHALHLKG